MMDYLAKAGLISLTARLRRLNEQVTQDVVNIYKHAGITVNLRYLPILVILHKQKTVTGSDLAKSLGYTKAGISQILGELLQEGYVSEQADRHDRRIKILRLTNQGHQLVTLLRPVWQQAETAFQEFSDDCQQDLSALLTLIESRLAQKSLLTYFTELDTSHAHH